MLIHIWLKQSDEAEVSLSCYTRQRSKGLVISIRQGTQGLTMTSDKPWRLGTNQENKAGVAWPS